MTLRSVVGKKNNQEASEALSDVSKLLSRLVNSRKAPSKLPEIISLTREVARLGRALNGYGADDRKNDGYGTGVDYGDTSLDQFKGVVR